MIFGGIVPDIQRLDYEISYVDPKRIYGIDNGGKLYTKNGMNHILGSGDNEKIEKKSLKEIDTTSIKSTITTFISDETLNIHSHQTSNDNLMSIMTESCTSNVSTKSLKEQSDSNVYQLSTPINVQFKRLHLEDIQKLNTPIKPLEQTIKEYSKEITEMTPKVIEAWKSYTTNFQELIKKCNLPENFPMPNTFKDHYEETNDVEINCYQENDKLESLNLITTLIGPLIEEPTSIGMTFSLKKEFDMYHQAYITRNMNSNIKKNITANDNKNKSHKNRLRRFNNFFSKIFF
ncbi:Hypothetical protein SRAE_2000062800 [Strongyloides ratti]|uniref:Uncharacterized protein n=1 Tax=Strongyloides ratti TaxID=34506 RepID=A0A090MXS7_STRRB|nr:Hypothetical protein SRAE_2000062800 [Strongyloides ratti]CEF65954.1 Hypothetical protein SRAE_2000062800 [Strongyloides ratti]